MNSPNFKTEIGKTRTTSKRFQKVSSLFSAAINAGKIISFWNLPHLSYSSPDPELADKDMYTTLVRMISPFNRLGSAMVDIFQYHGVSELCILWRYLWTDIKTCGVTEKKLWKDRLLPPASEGWGKVLFSQASVCPGARGGGGTYPGWGGGTPSRVGTPPP